MISFLRNTNANKKKEPETKFLKSNNVKKRLPNNLI